MARNYSEYLRRNLVLASSYGAQSLIDQALAHLLQMKRPPKWLLNDLKGAKNRVDKLPEHLAQWRDMAPDNPHK